MSKKRFERWNDHSCKVKDNQEDTFLNLEDVVNKLNAFAEKNKRLQQDRAKDAKEFSALFKQNLDLHLKNKKLQQEKEYYREYAIKYLTEYDLHSDNFLNILKDILVEEEFKKIKEEENKIKEALKKEGLYE